MTMVYYDCILLIIDGRFSKARYR